MRRVDRKNLLGALAFCASGAVFPNTSNAAAAVDVQILGSGGPEIGDRRAGSSYLLRIGGKAAALIDTGPGSSLNFEKSGADLNDLQAVLFTHFHVDHSGDFPALVKGSYFTGRTKDLPVYGPAGNDLMPSATEFVERLFGKSGIYRYLNEYVEPNVSSAFKIRATNVRFAKNRIQQFPIAPNLKISAVSVHHGPLPALAWRLDTEGCGVTISGDDSNRYETLVKLAEGSDLLIADHAIPEETTGVTRNLHMPPSEIGKIAQAASVKRLVLSHRMLRTEGRENESLAMIRRYYSGPVDFTDDMSTYPLTDCEN